MVVDGLQGYENPAEAETCPEKEVMDEQETATQRNELATHQHMMSSLTPQQSIAGGRMLGGHGTMLPWLSVGCKAGRARDGNRLPWRRRPTPKNMRRTKIHKILSDARN